MKTILLIIVSMCFGLMEVHAAYIKNQPYTVTQPDGTQINCFVSGDEYFNWIHDARGYTIVQSQDGWYYYGQQKDGIIVPTQYKVLAVDPEAVGLVLQARISRAEYQKNVAEWRTPNDIKNEGSVHSGRLNNLVIYIKFNDQTEFVKTRKEYNGLFNTNTKSLNSYYKDASYNMLDIVSSHYPESEMNINLSYTDSYPRSYYSPYNAATNLIGYSTSNQRRAREHTLLKNAIEWVNENSPVPNTLNIDNDDNGTVDNVCFIIRGNNDGWSSLLWAHRWNLSSYDVFINDKLVHDYTFQPEPQVVLTTVCHEMFHALGAPDLYHYSNEGYSPAGEWDLMESGAGHMSAHLKYKYSKGTWISEIPEITESGTYTLHPLSSPTNNCFKIASPNSTTEYFVVEYRKKGGLFEVNLPGSGLIVWRVISYLNGNSSGPPDEVYIYRPNGTVSNDGEINKAYFSSESGRTAINDYTNPEALLSTGEISNLYIYNVTKADSTLSFSVIISNTANPLELTADPVNSESVLLEWGLNPNGENVMLAYNTSPTFGIPEEGVSYTDGAELPGGGKVLHSASSNDFFMHTELSENTTYYYKLWSVTFGKNYSTGISANAKTLCGVRALPFEENFNSADNCWDEQKSTNIPIRWTYSESQLAGGLKGEIKATGYNRSPAFTQIVSPAFNTTGISELTLIFRHFVENNGSGATLRIKTSNDSINWTNADWEYQTSGTTPVKEQVVTTLTQNLNAPKTHIAFEFSGSLIRCKAWYLDDIMVSSETSLVLIVANADSIAYGAVYGAGRYPQNYSATLTAVSKGGYTFLHWTENGDIVSTDSVYTFVTIVNRDLKAVFEKSDAVATLNEATAFRFYPNPTTGELKIESGEWRMDGRVALFDITGRKVFEASLTGGVTTVNLSTLGSGVYIAKVFAGTALLTSHKIVKN